VAIAVNTFFENRVQELFDLAGRIEAAFSAAGIDYRIVGGLATYLYVEANEPDAGRLTKDIDIAIRREDLGRIARAVEPFGLECRHVAGLDLLVQKAQPSARRSVHLLFAGEKVREDYSEPVPALGQARVLKGLRLISLSDLVRMKLTSFRAKDEAHLKDLDEAGLLTPDVEAGLSGVLRERLKKMRERD
jgi:hypothetical protein